MAPKITTSSSDGDEAAAAAAVVAGPGQKRGKKNDGTPKQKHYAWNITADMRCSEFPAEPFEVRQTLKNGVQVSMLWCTACGKPVSHKTKCHVVTHLRRNQGGL